MDGFIAWWRGRAIRTDALLAAVLLVVDSAAAPFHAVPTWLWILTAALLAAPVALRRSRPWPAAVVVLIGGVVWLSTHVEATAFHFGLASTLVFAYTLLVHGGVRDAAAFTACLVLGIVAWSWWRVGAVGLLVLLWLVVPWAVGSAVLAARRQGAESARLTAAEEKVAMAREMHDTIAHALSVMVVLADGAAAQIRTDPQRAERALRTMGEAGRTGLSELRRMLDVLRQDHPPTTGPDGAAPHRDPGNDLVALAEQMTGAGLPTRLVLAGSLLGLPGTVSSGLYRIAQESLTNALRHGGVGSRAVLEVVVREGEVELGVSDDGAGARGAVGRGGNGLTGMRERAHACGGTLSAGPDPVRGGWTVRAVLPI
ncbi:histidine kinase [Pseudonocardia sp.]|uniref:sensor histidine kinase n=1 Tax=Pseudonocardia sp. TaxID=60912 RepID=UPI002602DD75|nr:histidine kinase [Pseudonocardia sp.]